MQRLRAVVQQARFGSTGADGFSGIALDPQGRMLVVGTTGGGLDFGNGSLPCIPQKMCAVFARFAPSGTLDTDGQFSSKGGSSGLSISHGGNGIVVAMSDIGLTNFGGTYEGTTKGALSIVSPP